RGRLSAAWPRVVQCGTLVSLGVPGCERSARLTAIGCEGDWPPSNPRAPIHVEVLAALCIGERPSRLVSRDLEEIVEVEGPDPDTVAPARGGELRAVRTEGHALHGASGPSEAQP